MLPTRWQYMDFGDGRERISAPDRGGWNGSMRVVLEHHYAVWFGDDWHEHDKFSWSNKNNDGRPQAVGLLPANLLACTTFMGMSGMVSRLE